MPLYNHAQYQVATKALLFKDDQILVLITPDGYLDFPGGRADESERNLPWTEALRREVAEELGEQVSIEIGQTLFVSKRQYDKNDETNYIQQYFLNVSTLMATLSFQTSTPIINGLLQKK